MDRHPVTRTTADAFFAEATRRFGPDSKNWRFVCPCCGHEAALREWIDADAPNAAGFSCIGRFLPGTPRDAFEGRGKGPCNYAGGGLFRLNPMIVVTPDGIEHNMFALAGDRFPIVKTAEAVDG